jgi:hypothetical protein
MSLAQRSIDLNRSKDIDLEDYRKDLNKLLNWAKFYFDKALADNFVAGNNKVAAPDNKLAQNIADIGVAGCSSANFYSELQNFLLRYFYQKLRRKRQTKNNKPKKQRIR